MTYAHPLQVGDINPYLRTPLVESVSLSRLAGCKVYLKYECSQPSGSFKSRGLGMLVHYSINEAKKLGYEQRPHFYSSSGGNAGYATALACTLYEAPCTVVMPVISKQIMQQKIKATGADVILHGHNIQEADLYLKELLNKRREEGDFNCVYCHPFDNPVVWEGHSTIVDEIIDANINISKLRAVACSVGGGGLLNGIVQGLLRNGLTVPVIAIETEGAPTLQRTIEENQVIHLETVNTVATSLACKYVPQKTLEYCQVYDIRSVLVSDNQAVTSCIKFSLDHNVIVEPACGACLASVYFSKLDTLGLNLQPDDAIVIIVCGGSSTTFEDLHEFAKSLT
ncbi:BA75_02300T0 [Komagataella pastoris]|uniref:L-serine ammonia-lyase n=1 Tax=Komagataella pastoris TaxID=4922 RepID=A0A1B2JCU1_PICPA|nr:BA75_02300T0 [Komagataella pastoris]